MKSVKKYPIIGGPLDGKFANTKDWFRAYHSTHYSQDEGQFFPWADQYVRYSAGDRRAPTSSVYLYKPDIPGAIKAPQREPDIEED